MGKLRVGLFFGGRSTEHEVSVISALQAYQHLDKDKYEIIPVYVSKAGGFYTGEKFLDLKNYQDVDSLLLSSQQIVSNRQKETGGYLTTSNLINRFTPLDVAFPLFHGSFGEDGCIQGLFELYQIPYVGLGVMGSAVAMDKVISKSLFRSLGLNVAKFAQIKRSDWIVDQKQQLNIVKKFLKFPMFVKPATSGSSIGVNKAKDEEDLAFNLEVAFTYSDKVIVEEYFEDVFEVNCSVLGYGNEFAASVCEMPKASGEMLSFDDKYRKGGKGSNPSAGSGLKGSGMASLSRVIPAPIPEKLAREIQESTIKIFKALDGCGVARIDYFVDHKRQIFWVNEVNSPPGSLAFYLWEPTGLKYKDLLDKLIEYGLKRAQDQKKTRYTFDSGLLSQMSQSGGVKR